MCPEERRNKLLKKKNPDGEGACERDLRGFTPMAVGGQNTQPSKRLSFGPRCLALALFRVKQLLGSNLRKILTGRDISLSIRYHLPI